MSIASTNPFTGETVKTFDPHTGAQVEARLAKAESAFHEWRKRSFAEKAALVRKAADVLDQRKEELSRLMTLEMGKLHQAGVGEVEKCASTCRYYADHAHEHLADRVIATDAKRSLVRYQPLGPVLAVMPWNFPFWQVFRFAAPALMAGNVGLLKHASNVPQTALAIEEVFAQAGLPEGCFQTLLIESKRVAQIIGDPRVKAGTLTGSEAAGKSLAQAAGEHLKKVVLELGGSDPFVVLPSADLEKAVETAVKARVQNAGQSCIAAKRFIVHERIAEKFEQAFVRQMAALRIGDPADDATQLGPVASKQVLDDVDDQVKRSLAQGAKALTGGHRIARKGFFYAPTVLRVTPGKDATAWTEEIFGPVATLVRARDLDHAIELANDTPFGLGSAAFTRDEKEQERLCDELDAGQVFINGMVKSDPRLPFGGVKSSGYGRELSGEGIREFTNAKTIWIG